MKRVTVYYTRNKKDKPKFSFRRTVHSSVCGYYKQDTHPEGDGLIHYHTISTWIEIPQPSAHWINTHRPQAI